MKLRNFACILAVLLAATGALFLAGCETVDTRIQRNPSAFESLSPQDQQLVRQGQIRSGMPASAVYLAWGAPRLKTTANVRGRPADTWVYTAQTGAPYPYWGGGFGLGFYGGGRYYFHHGRRFYGFGYDPFYDPFFWNTTVEYPDRTVSFQGGRVVAFQFLAPPGFRF